MTPWLLLHGALGSAAQFQPLQKELPPDWPVHTLNFPGHGGLAIGHPFSMRLFSDAVLRFLDDQHLSEVNIFGYSMGGYVALGLAGKYPERIRQVVTLGTKLDWSPEVAAGMNRLFDPEKIVAKVPQFAQQLAQAHAPADWQEVCRYTAGFLRDLGNGQGLSADAYSRIICPVTISWGEQDNVVSAEESRRVAGQIALGKFQMLAGFKHPFEQIDMAELARNLFFLFFIALQV